MAYLRSIAEQDADVLLRELYDEDLKRRGYVANYTKAMSLRPDVIRAWRDLHMSIRKHMRMRRYELVTIAASTALGCTYWTLAHGAALRKEIFSDDELEAVVRDFRHAGLEADEVAIMAFAQKVILEPGTITSGDVDELRSFGLADEEILDIVTTATARSFFSKTLDALAAVPDDAYLQLDDDLRQALTVGRPFPSDPDV
jgi:uncharacterized peroxidase-related enzyme